MQLRLAVRLLLITSLVVGLVSFAGAQTAASGKPDKVKAPLSAIDHSGQQAAVDAKGKLRQPTPEELEVLASSLSAKLDQSFDESKVQRHADGTLAVFAGDTNMNFILIKTNADGTTSTRCVENMKQVREFLGLPNKSEAPKKNAPKLDANGLEVE